MRTGVTGEGLGEERDPDFRSPRVPPTGLLTVSAISGEPLGGRGPPRGDRKHRP